MLRLLPDVPNQDIYLTLQDAARDYVYTNYLFELVHRMTKEKFYFVAYIVADNPRYTRVRVSTDTTDTNNVTLSESGYYDYRVYVQNSATNVDPTAALARVEIGTLYVVGDAVTTAPEVPLTNDIVYYAGQ